MADAQRESLGTRLRQERERHHWTQEYLAEVIGGSVPSINRWEHDRAMPRHDVLALLVDVFGRPPEQWGTANQIPWNVPFLRNPYFMGRERILQRLHQALAASQTVALSQTRAISGLGGIGKTQTAVEYAYRYADEYEAVLWIRADSTEDLMSDFAALTLVLDLPAQHQRDQQYAISIVKRWLEEHGPWLLIFDNADDPTLVTDFLPRRAGGAVLLTTRSQATGPYMKKIEVEKMSREEGIAFLLHRANADEEERVSAGVSQHEVAEHLWEAIDGLPLALDQAAAYIEETGCTFSDYLALFKTRSKQLLRLRGHVANTHPEPVATTWLLAFEKLEHSNPAAAELLRLCAFLHPDEISEAMMIAGASALGPVLQSIASDEVEWNRAIGQLRKYSLVKRDAEKKVLNIHRLVQAVIKDSMDQETVRQWAVQSVRAVATAFPEAVAANWPHCEQCLPHVQSCLEFINQYSLGFPEAIHLLNQAGDYLWKRERFAQAQPLLQQALMICEKVLDPEHPDTSETLNNLAEVYREQGRYEQAEPLFQRALAIREKILGPKHPDTSETLNNLAWLYNDQGKYEQAEPLYLRALAIRETVLGPEHPDTSETLNNLAVLYFELGRYEQAEPLYLRALAIRETVLGPEHPHTATSFFGLASLSRKQGKYEQAEHFYLRALTIDEKTLESEDPNIAWDLFGLAELYHEQGKYEQAEPLYLRVLTVRETLLGPEHPHTATVIKNLAVLYSEQGQYEQAEPLFQRALAICEKMLGPEHPRTAAVLDAQGHLAVLQGREEQAESHLLLALTIREQVFGTRHPDVAETLQHLAELYEKQSQYEQAHTYYQRTLVIHKQAFGGHHPKTIETRTRLIALLHAIGQHEEAARLEAGQSEQRTHEEEGRAHPDY